MSNINNNINNNNNNSMHHRSSSSSSSNSMIINSSSLFSNAMMLGPSSSFFTSNNNNNNNMSHNNTSNHFYNNNNNNNNFYNSSVNNNGQFSSYNNINNINNNMNNNMNCNNNNSGDLVCWNPHTSTRFNVISNRDVHYYRINEEVFNRVVENGFDDSVEIMHRKQEDLFHLISTTNLPYPAKCHSWSPDHRDIIALGLQNGTVVLNNIRLNKIVTEFVPKSVRPCKSLSWNPTQTNLIAAGFDKMRSDGGVVVWDVNMLDLEMMRVMMDDGTSSVSSVTSGGGGGGMNGGGGAIGGGVGGGGGGLMNFYRSSSSTSLSSFDVANSNNNNMSNNNSSSSSNYVNHSMGRSRSLSVLERIDKPAYEVGLSDAAHAVCWIPGQRISLLMAANPRYLRVYDLREYTNLKATRPSVNFAAHNKSIQGISFNPVDQHQFASFSEDGQVKVWDMRKLPNPLRELPISSKRDPSIAQIEWSSTNRNVLGVLMRDGQSIRLWNLNPPGTDRSVRAALSPYKSLYTRDEPIASFSFHPNIARCMLVSTQSGQIKYVFTKDYPKFSISPRGTIVSLHQKLMIERMLTQTSPTSSLSTSNNNNNEMVDYCCLMKTRADKSIGMNHAKNLEIAKEMKEQDMIELWSWINRVKQLNESGDRKLHPSQHNYTGVKSLLTASLDSPIMFKLPPTSPFTSSKFSDYPKNLQFTTTPVLQQSPPTTPLSSTSFSGGQAVQEVFETQARISRLFPSLKVYSSPQRSLIVEMCGWGQSLLNNINTCLEAAMKRSNSAAALNNMSHMSNQGFMSSSSSMMSIVDEEAEDVATKLLKSQYLNERSVAIAIFAMDLNLAARLLIAIEDEQRRVGHNSGNNYKFLAYALGGFSGDRQREFKEVYSSLYPMHPNPYLRAALGFLSEISSTYDYSTVLNEAQISLCDRLAFASIYLPPDHLSIYVNRMSEESIQKGHLPGIILTGLNRDAVDLVQNYVDRTGDIQIACLLLKTVVPAQFEDKRVDVWLYNYRELLDQWQMWETRAYLDTKLNQYTSEKVSTRSTPEVSVKCTFCNQALVHKVLSSNRRNQLNNFTNKMGSGSYATRAKSTSCPSCRKPLPKCSICLMPFGSPHHSLGGNQQSSSQQHPSTHMGHHHGSEESATTTPGHQYGQLDYCFSWCTKCKHGGHVKHLMEWFSTHSVCAVSGCDCACFSPLASNGPTPAPSTTNATIPQ